jgi:L-threonylcarbamoyladenylate synthase
VGSNAKQRNLKAIVKLVPVDPRQPAAGVITQAADLIRQGRVVIFPTRGLYGLAADALNSQAIDRVFTLKGRVRAKPLLVLIHQPNLLNRLVTRINPLAQHLIEAFWPGWVTFILPAATGLPEGLTSDEGKVGVRLAGHSVAAALCAAVGGPITGTSANLSGAGGCAGVEEIDPVVLGASDLILDAGRLEGGPGSTVVDVCGPTPIILRHGAVPDERIMAVFHQFSA